MVGLLLAAGSGYFLLQFNLGRGLVNLSYDLLPVWRGDVATESVVMVYLDERSHLEMEQDQNKPWSRALHAALLDRLTRAGARAVVFDIVFSDPDARSEEHDRLLAEAMRRNGRVILAADLVPMGEKINEIVPPIDLLLDEAAGLGLADVKPDRDLVVRRHAPAMEEVVPSLSWAAAEFLEAEVTRGGPGKTGPKWLNYYGRPNVMPWVSYVDALKPDAVQDDFFKDKVVFVGARVLTLSFGERKDEYRSPYSTLMPDELAVNRGLFIPGVYIQATSFLNLYRGDWLSRWSPDWELAVVLACAIIWGVGLVWIRPGWATGAALGGMVLITAVFYALYRLEHVWFPWVILLGQIGLALAWSILFNSFQLYVQKRMYEYTLGLYLSPKLVQKFSGNAHLLKPGAEELTLTILFSDIANFTDLSQQISSAELAAVMNAYFQVAVSECIHKTDGTVVKYIGDAVFAFWNAPEPQADHARRACEAALEFRGRNQIEVKGKPLVTRLGLHTGAAHVGNFGSLERVDYTALGESVNLASRLEGLNKYLGTSCLISGDTFRALQGGLVTRPMGDFQLKGFGSHVEVHELVGRLEEEASTRPWRESFAQALDNYQNKNFEFAAMGFQQTLELRPEDGPSLFYLAKIEEIQTQALPDTWTGQTQMFDK